MAATHRKRVLIIDDDERNLIAPEGLFESRGYDTVTAWSGKDALRLLHSENSDVVLLDDFLPDVPSAEILNEIRQLPIQPLVALLRPSGQPGATTIEYVRLRADCSISKLSVAAILGAIQECLSHHGPLAMRDRRELVVTRT